MSPPTPRYDSEPGGGGDPTPAPTPRYPEHAKLEALGGKNQVVADFLDWLKDDQHVHLMLWEKTPDRYDNGYWYEDRRHPELLVAAYFGLDVWKLEAEKRQMLDEIRRADARRPAE